MPIQNVFYNSEKIAFEVEYISIKQEETTIGILIGSLRNPYEKARLHVHCDEKHRLRAITTQLVLFENGILCSIHTKNVAKFMLPKHSTYPLGKRFILNEMSSLS